MPLLGNGIATEKAVVNAPVGLPIQRMHDAAGEAGIYMRAHASSQRSGAAGTMDSSVVDDNATLATQVVTVEAPSGERKTIGIRDGKIAWHQG